MDDVTVAAEVAFAFYEAYEDLAPGFGYETREEAKAWDPASSDARLMTATVGRLLENGTIALGPRYAEATAGEPAAPVEGATGRGSGPAAVPDDASEHERLLLELAQRGAVPAGLGIGRVVVFRSRTGQYDVPAIVTATIHSLSPFGVRAFDRSRQEGAEVLEPVLRGVPPLTAAENVHLTVLTPGLPGQRATADDFVVPPSFGLEPMENVGGSYQEFDVPFAGDGVTPAPGTWRWPERS